MAGMVRKQQARQQASLACVYQRELALEKAVSERGQENTEQAAVMSQLADEVAALTKIHEPIKGRAGMHMPQLVAWQSCMTCCVRLLWKQAMFC